jgi:hypothetical protein
MKALASGVFICEPASDLAKNLWICPPLQSAYGILVYKIHISEVNLLLYYMKMRHCIYPTYCAPTQCLLALASTSLIFLHFFIHSHRELTRVLRHLLYVRCLLTGFDPEPGKGPA